MEIGFSDARRQRIFSDLDLLRSQFGVDLAEKIALSQANGEQILAIVATAGTTDAGAIDPLRAIATLAAELGPRDAHKAVTVRLETTRKLGEAASAELRLVVYIEPEVNCP